MYPCLHAIEICLLFLPFLRTAGRRHSQPQGEVLSEQSTTENFRATTLQGSSVCAQLYFKRKRYKTFALHPHRKLSGFRAQLVCNCPCLHSVKLILLNYHKVLHSSRHFSIWIITTAACTQAWVHVSITYLHGHTSYLTYCLNDRTYLPPAADSAMFPAYSLLWLNAHYPIVATLCRASKLPIDISFLFITSLIVEAFVQVVSRSLPHNP